MGTSGSRKLTSKVVPKRKPIAAKHNGRCEVLTLDALQDTRGKPKYDMRTMARCAIGRGKKTQEDIRNALEAKFPGIDPDGHGAWKQTLRHTLSNYHCFVRVPRPEHEPGQGDYWKVVGDSKESRSQRYKKSVRSAKRSASTTALEDVNIGDRHVTYHQDEDYHHDDDWDEDVAIDSFHAADSRLPQLEQWRPQTSINAAPGFLPQISAMRHAFVSAPPARDRYNTSRLVLDNSAASDGLDDYTRARSSRNNLPASGAPFVPYHHDMLELREAYFGTVPASTRGAGDSADLYVGNRALQYSAYNGPRWTLEEEGGNHLPPYSGPARLSTTRSTSSTGYGTASGSGAGDTDPYVGDQDLQYSAVFNPYNGARWTPEEDGRQRGLGEHLPRAPYSDPAQLSTTRSTSSTASGSGAGDTNPYFGNQALQYSAYNGPRWTLEEGGRRGENLPRAPDSDPAQLSTTRSTSSTVTGGNPAATLSPARKLSYLLN